MPMKFKILKVGLTLASKLNQNRDLLFLELQIFSEEKSYQLKSFLVRDVSTVPEFFEKIIQIPGCGEHQSRLGT